MANHEAQTAPLIARWDTFLAKCQGSGNQTHSWLRKAVPLQLA